MSLTLGQALMSNVVNHRQASALIMLPTPSSVIPPFPLNIKDSMATVQKIKKSETQEKQM